MYKLYLEIDVRDDNDALTNSSLRDLINFQKQQRDVGVNGNTDWLKRAQKQ
jgi:hypothetical protein